MLALSALSTSFLVPALRASPPLSSLPAQSAGLSPAPPAVVAEAARRGGGVVRMEETEGPSETLQALGVAGGAPTSLYGFRDAGQTVGRAYFGGLAMPDGEVSVTVRSYNNAKVAE